jgi:hypothetical protein
LQQLHRACASFFAADLGQHQRRFHVLDGTARRQQIKRLKDETDAAATITDQLFIAGFAKLQTIDLDFATLGRSSPP